MWNLAVLNFFFSISMILSWSECDRTNQQSFKIKGGSSCWLGVNRPDGHQECIPWICETSPDLVLRWWRTAKKQKQNPSLNYICFATGMHLLPFCNITQLKKRGLQLMKKKSHSIPPQWCQSQNESQTLDVEPHDSCFSFCVTVKTSGTYWSHCAGQGGVLRQQQLH